MADSPDLLTIGEVARLAGLAPSALRYYESQGLVEPARRVGGQRRYEPRVLRRLEVIDLAKRAGFSLAEARQLLDGFEDGVPASERWRALAQRKLPEVQGLIDQAQAMKRLLDSGLSCACLRLDRNTVFAGSDRCWSRPSPFALGRGPGLVHASLVFDTLVWKDASGDFLPWLARDWECTGDRRQWRFRLRKGIRWHDGAPLRAHDVAFTFEYLIHGPASRMELIQRQGLDAVTGVKVTGPDEVVIDLDATCPSFEEQVAGRLLILPEHIWSAVDEPGHQLGPASVVGSGPYRLVSYDPADGSCAYDANHDHFLGVPYVRRLEFLALPDPLAAFHRGEVDAVNAGGEDAGFNAAFGAVRHRTYATLAARGEWTRSLYFNLSAGFPFHDPRFRRAVAHAIDRDDLVRLLLFGRGEPASTGGLAPSHPMIAPGLPTYPHDLARAEAILDDLGLSTAEGGRRCVVGLQTVESSVATAELLAAQLARVGIEVDLDVRSLAAADEAARDGRYEMALVGHGGLGGDPDWLRRQLSPLTGDQSRTGVHGYRNPLFEALAEQQRHTEDLGDRRRLVQEMQRLVAEDLPMIGLYVPTRVIAYDEHVFDAWYFTPGGVWGAYPGALNKHALVTGRQTGLEPAGPRGSPAPRARSTP